MSNTPTFLIGLPHLRWVPPGNAARAAIAREFRAPISVALPDASALLGWLQTSSDNEPTFDRCLLPGESIRSPLPTAAGKRWSAACIEYFGQVQACAIRDGVSGKLLLLRAPLGELPVCFMRMAGLTAVAFTAETLAREFPRHVHVDHGRVADALVGFLQWIDLRSTLYREIRKIPAGCWVLVDGDLVREGRYWEPAPATLPSSLRTDSDFEQAMLDLLTRAVAVRSGTSKGRVGSMLSGGMDSGSIVAIAGRMRLDRGEGALPTLSLVRSGDPGCVESNAVTAAARMSGVAPERLDLSVLGSEAAELEAALWDSDEPWDVNGSLFRWVYRRAAQLRLTVVLDGVDGDSLFLEGDLIVRQLRQLHWRRAWRNVAVGTRFWGTDASAWRAYMGACRMAFGIGASARLRKLKAAVTGKPAAQTDRLTRLVEQYPIDPGFARTVDLEGRAARYDESERECRAFDLRGPELGMERYFRFAAPQGVIPAHPFMDPEMVQFCLALPREQCLQDGWPKSLLRRAMKGLLPDAVRWRMGKQHLGFDLTRAVVSSNPEPLHRRLNLLRPTLDGVVSQPVLDHHCAGAIRDEEDLLQRIELLGLAEWLHRRSHLL